jgi:predicted amidohydrolase YtcJ
VLDAYDLAFGHDTAAVAAAAPRIEHASVLSDDLIARMAANGVVACIQPSFPVSDAGMLGPALGQARLRHRRLPAAQALLPVAAAFAVMTDPAAGQTLLSADPRSADDIDRIEVAGTVPVPF